LGWLGKEKGREECLRGALSRFIGRLGKEKGVQRRGCFTNLGIGKENLYILITKPQYILITKPQYILITKPQYILITKPQIGNGNGVAYEKFI